jgi:fructose-1,6-bisphosphatase-3
MDLAAGTIQIDGKTWPLLDTHLPTIDPKDPYALSEAERQCMDRTRESFLGSDKLWAQMRYLTGIGSMYTQRDNCLVFHGCVPVDESGNFLTLEVDGQPRAGRALFEALDRVIVRALDQRDLKDLDMMWYLWCGPLSPLFGKDRITTLETYFVADPATQEEVKNPYFSLINQVAFCDRILGEFGVDPADGLIVNGHVPVKIEKGEDPQKRGGKAITIDGAFSEAYGDHGYTLVLEADRIFLATHYHFESVEAALRDGVDIIPAITPIRAFPAPRRVADTEEGRRIRAEMAWVEKLIEAYRTHVLLER